MKSKKIIFLTLALLIVAFSLVTNSYAWFTGTKRTGRMVFTSGEVRYEFINPYEYFIDKDIPIIPSQELIEDGKTLSVFNFSTVDSELRIKIAISYKIDDNKTINYLTNNQDDYVQGVMYEGEDNAGWRFEGIGETGHWYYYTSSNNPVIPAFDTEEGGTQIKMLESIILNGKYFGNNVSLKEVSIIVVFQAMQSEFATWEDIGTIQITLD